MKKLIVAAIFIAMGNTSFSQSLGYQDLALLFSQNQQQGTARFNAMGGAFGALGGDLSAISINPAGLSIFNKSIFSGTLNSRRTDISSVYYGNGITTQEEFINLSQGGAVLVFDSSYTSDWNKFALGFNYRITNDFDANWLASGNSGVATFTEFPLDNGNPPNQYDVAENQFFNNRYNGELSELSVGLSAVHQNKFYLGLGLNFVDLNFVQQSALTEQNRDSNGNTLDADLYQENYTTGVGFGANLGFIYKAHKNFRFGFSYQTPTWFSEIIEESNIVNNDGYFGDTQITVSNDNTIYDNTFGGNLPVQNLLYRLRTPGQITASAALIIGKFGLISVDYSNRYFRNMRLTNDNFATENQFFQNELQNTNNLNVGTELRFERFSIRGGYRYAESPDKLAIESDHFKSYSVGAGYNFGTFKLDFSYSDSNQTSVYNFYPGFNVNAADLSIDNKIFTGTVTINL